MCIRDSLIAGRAQHVVARQHRGHRRFTRGIAGGHGLHHQVVRHHHARKAQLFPQEIVHPKRQRGRAVPVHAGHHVVADQHTVCLLYTSGTNLVRLFYYDQSPID